MNEPVNALFPRYSRAAYHALKLIIGTAMRTAYTVHVQGLENVPMHGPAILAANHVSFLDSFFIPLVAGRRVTYLAKAEYWDSWKTRWFFDSVGQIPLRRQDSEKAQGALDAGVTVLRAGGLLGIYPEGTRSPDGRLHKGKTGVARMALEAGCAVVPVGLIGTGDVMPKEAKLPRLRGDITVRFGQPRRPVERAEAGPLAYRTFVDVLMYDICEMTGQEYVDRYADKRPQPDVEIEQIPPLLVEPVGA